MSDGGEVFLFVLAILIFFIWLISAMAAHRKRGPIVWLLIAAFGSPFLAILLLIALGDAPKREGL